MKKKRMVWRRGFSLCLALLLCLSLLPAEVFAADTELKIFQINGTDVTSENAGKLDASNGVTYGTNGSISYDPDTGTLTLNNVTIERTGSNEPITCTNPGAAGTIKLIGKNTLVCSKGSVSSATKNYCAIGTSCLTTLTIEGASRSDSLTITTGTMQPQYMSGGICLPQSGSSVTVRNCTLDILCEGTSKDSCSTNAIYTKDGSITIDHANVNAVIGKNSSQKTLYVFGGTAIYSEGGTLSIVSSDITAGAYSTKAGCWLAGLEGETLDITDSILNLTVERPESGTAANAARAIAAGSKCTIDRCTGTMSGATTVLRALQLFPVVH